MITAKNVTEAKKLAREEVLRNVLEGLGMTQFSDAEAATTVDVMVGEGDTAKAQTLFVGVTVATKQEKDTSRAKAFDLDSKIKEWEAEKVEKAQAAAEKAAEKAAKEAKAKAKAAE